MSTGSSNTTTTSQQSAPWQPIQPYLTDLAGQASNLYQQQQGQTAYPDTVPALSPQTQAALNDTWQRASNGSPVVNAADQTDTGLMSQQNAALPLASQLAASGPNISAAAVNPYLDQMFSAEAQPVTDAVNAQFGLAGRTGSGAQQQELTRNLGDLASQVYGNNYLGEQQLGLNAYNAQANAVNQLGSLSSSDLSRQLSAAGLAPTLANQDYTDLQNLLNVGGTYDTYNQNVANNQLAAWQYAQQQPWNILNNYSGVVTGLGGLGGTSSGTNTTSQNQSLIPSLIGAGSSLLGFL